MRCDDQSSHSQQGLLAAVSAAASRGLLPGPGGHAALARLRGNTKVRGYWAAGAGRMGRQGLSMKRHLKLQLKTSVTPRSRFKELGKMAGRKPN